MENQEDDADPGMITSDVQWKIGTYGMTTPWTKGLVREKRQCGKMWLKIDDCESFLLEICMQVPCFLIKLCLNEYPNLFEFLL